jgi:hypothetical protein
MHDWFAKQTVNIQMSAGYILVANLAPFSSGWGSSKPRFSELLRDHELAQFHDVGRPHRPTCTQLRTPFEFANIASSLFSALISLIYGILLGEPF